MSIFIATDKAGKPLTEGEDIRHTTGWYATFEGLAECDDEERPTKILVRWPTGDTVFSYEPRQFETKILVINGSEGDYRKHLQETKLRLELARMTEESKVLPNTYPSVTVELTWYEAIALEMALEKAIA